MNTTEISRYVINGLIATLVHFVVLILNLKWVGFESAGFSNFIAAMFGITASYIGSRYYVFQQYETAIIRQGSLFILLYASIAVFHGLILMIWTDIYAYDYRIGFLVATFFQVCLSYLGNKYLVFGT